MRAKDKYHHFYVSLQAISMFILGKQLCTERSLSLDALTLNADIATTGYN